MFLWYQKWVSISHFTDWVPHILSDFSTFLLFCFHARCKLAILFQVFQAKENSHTESTWSSQFLRLISLHNRYNYMSWCIDWKGNDSNWSHYSDGFNSLQWILFSWRFRRCVTTAIAPQCDWFEEIFAFRNLPKLISMNRRNKSTCNNNWVASPFFKHSNGPFVYSMYALDLRPKKNGRRALA